MSNIFSNLKSKTQQAEAPVDRLGGSGFAAKETDIYFGDIKIAYAGQSDGGANFLQVIIENLVNATTGASAGEYREQLFFTSGNDKGNSPTYEKNGKQFFLPGYTIANDILLFAAGTELPDTAFEEKVVNVYDREQQKEIPKSVMVPVEAVGKKIALAIKKSVEPKQEKVNGVYVDTTEPQEKNSIDKIFHPEYKLTVLEASNLKSEPTEADAVFWGVWLETNQGKIDDYKMKKSQAGGGKTGAPPVAGGATASTGGSTAKKSLFGNK